MKLMRWFATLLVAMTLVVGLVAAPRPAAAIDDRYPWLQPPPEEAGEPDGPGPGSVEILRSMFIFNLLFRINSDLASLSVQRAAVHHTSMSRRMNSTRVPSR
jgi:hypothetical protein